MKDLWKSGGVAYGVWTTLADPVSIGIAGRAGFEYTCVDLQHGLATFSEVPTILRYLRDSGTTPIVRVAANEEALINRALDLGARGVVVPLVNTTEEAEAAVRACLYPALPGGTDDLISRGGGRSWGPIFADLDGARDTDADNLAAICIVQIETRQAIDNLADIAAVPGIDALYVGPNDLALGCGYGRATYRDKSEIATMIEAVIAACKKNDIVAGVHCSDIDMVHHWRAKGAQMLTAGIDTTIVRVALRQHYTSASAQ